MIYDNKILLDNCNVEVITITRLHFRFENKIILGAGCLPDFNSSCHILCLLRCDVINLKIHFTLAMMPFIKLTLHILCILSLGSIRLSTPFLSLAFWKHFPPKFFLDIKILIFLRISSCTALCISEENSYRRSLNTRLRQWILVFKVVLFNQF